MKIKMLLSPYNPPCNVFKRMKTTDDKRTALDVVVEGIVCNLGHV